MAQGMERIPLAVDSDFKVDPVRAKFPDQQETDYKLVAFEPDQAATQPAPTSMGAGDTLSALGRNVWDAVVYHTPAAVASAIEGDEPYKTRDWKDALIERARERSKAVSQPGDAQTKTIIPGMTKQDINSLGPSLGFSVAGAGAGLGAGIPAGVAGSVVGTPAVGTVAGYTAGMAASGKAAYNMATNQFVRDLHDAANEEAIKATGKPVSPEAFAARQAELSRVIRDYGLWEAVPEAAGNALGFGILTAPVKGAIGKLFGKNIATRFASKMGALYGGELSTETVTQMGQHNAEVEAGMSKAPVRSFTSPTDWGESLREVAAPTILQTTLMAGGFKAGQMAKDRLAGKKGEEPPDNAIPADDLGAGPGGNAISGEFIPADQRQALPNMPDPGTTYDQDRTALPPGQTMLPLPMLPAPKDGGPSERQIATARGLLNHSPKASPELLQRLMRVDQATAAMLFNHWQGLKNGEVAGNQGAQVPAEGGQGQGADDAGSGILDGQRDGAMPFAMGEPAALAAPGGEPGMAVGATGAGADAVTPLDVQAHGAATSPYNATPQPTEAQKKAGNYAKGHVRFNGMDISIENPAGSVRSGTDEDGKAWENTLQHHYGYIKGTVGRDKDHLDVFIKPGAQSARTAYVIDQINPKTGRFDEHKIVLGASSEAEARAIYKANYADGWNGLGEITAMPIATFKGWIKSGKTKKPIAYVEPKEVRAAARKPATASNILQAIVNRGGISRDIMSDVGADTSARYMPGLFTNNGTTDLSTLAGDLFDEDGFHQIRQDSDIGPARELEELIVRALGGEKILSTAAMEKGMQAEENAKLKEKARRLGVKTVARKIEDIAADVARAEEQSILDEETRLEDDALVAYNEAVDALREAVGEDAAENFLEDLASRYQDETHLNYLRSATVDLQEQLNAEVQASGKPDEVAAGQAGSGYETGLAQGGADSLREAAQAAPALSSQSEALNHDDNSNHKLSRKSRAEGGRLQGDTTDSGGNRQNSGVDAANDQERATGRQAPSFTLDQQTEEDLAARDREQKAAEAQRLKDEQAAENKRQADAERGSFSLTGSDRPADVLAAQGQGDIFAQSNQEPRATTPVAESQAPATSEPGDAGVAPGRDGGAPDIRDSQTANERQKDAKGNPIYKMGDRVEYVDGGYKGRHGEISQVTPIRMVTVMLGTGARNEGETNYYYHVKTDNGADFMASPEEIRFEESKPESVVPDIAVDGMVIEPRRVLDGIGYAKRSAEGSRAAAQRAKKASSIADHKRQAVTQDEKAARYQAAWDAWAAKYPAEAEKLAPKPATPNVAGATPNVATAAAGDVLKAAGLKVTKTTTKNSKPVWEVGGNTREHSDMLKRLGGRWYGPKKVWSFYNDDPTPAITLKLGGQVTIAGTPTIQMPDKSLEQIAASSQPAAVKAQAELDAREQADDVDLGALFDEVLAEEMAPKARWESYEVVTSPREGRFLVREARGDGTYQNLAEFGFSGGRVVKLQHFFESPSTRIPTEMAIDRWRNEQNGWSKTRTATQAAASAAINTGKGLLDAIDGLGKLFGSNGSRLSMGISFDEDTYAKAKPLFAQAVAHFKDAGADLKEAMRAVVRLVLDKFGPQVTENMKPYIVQFMEDVKSGNVVYDETKEAGSNGNDRGRPETAGTGSAGQRDGGGDAAPRERPGRDTEAGDREGDRGDGTGRAGGGQSLDPMAQENAGAGSRGQSDRGDQGRGGAVAPGAGTRGSEPLAGRDREPATVRDRPGSATPGAVAGTSSKTPSTEGVSVSGKADFQITEDDNIGEGGQKTKARNNIAAIRLLKKLDSEDRRATPAEQKVLAKYVGWGGIKQIFDDSKADWAKERNEFKALVTDQEYAAARRSMLDAHYTSTDVVSGMWAAAAHLGFKGGRVLEPSVGVGNFFGLMPTDIRAHSQLYGVELDRITAQLAQNLYPSATIANMGFQDVELPSGSFDIAIGNPPFGDQSLYDKNHPELRSFPIHSFFFAKTLDKIRPGGIMPLVVSRYLMDNRDATGFAAREYLAGRAKLLGAIRLPYNAFLGNANTEVVTDIIFLQKLKDGETAERNWSSVKDIETTHPKTGEKFSFPINEYFIAHPEMVLGTHAPTGKMRAANQYNVEPLEGESLFQGLGRAIANLPRDVMAPATKPLADIMTAVSEVPEGTKVLGYYMAGNVVMQRQSDAMGKRRGVPVEFKDATAPKRAEAMIGIRNAVRDLMRAERADLPDSTLATKRARLTKLYDAFKGQYGYINQPANRRAFRDDPDLPLLESLEPKFDPGLGAEAAKKRGEAARKPAAEKADIFTKRVLPAHQEITSVSSANDALVVSLNMKGDVDPEYMAELYGKPWDQIRAELGALVFHNPNGGWESADAYLSGNVKAKLKIAEAAAARDPQYAPNVEALQAVIPADVPALKISVRLGSPWVPSDVMAQFASELWGVKDASIKFVKQVARWAVKADGGDPTARTSTWGVTYTKLSGGSGIFGADMILDHVANNRAIVIKENLGDSEHPNWQTNERATEAIRAKAQEMATKFREWIWQDQDRRDRLAKIYNETYNTDKRRAYDGSHLTLPGSSSLIKLRAHQLNAVWRAIQDRVILLDHVVGAGKTYEMAAIAMELRRLGITRKPMFVVPNSLVRQWRDEFYKLYPDANVLAATEADFAKANRKRFMAKIATGDWDAVIVAHSSFKKVGMPYETEKAILDEQLKEISDAIEDMKRERGDKNVVRDMERIKIKLDERMKSLADRGGKKDDTVSFDELGVDGLFVDEAHLFKNLFYYSQMRNVTGLGNPNGSGRAFDLFVKTRFLDQQYAGKALVGFATGTPVSNSLVEMFTMQRYLAWNKLKENGLHLLDAWAGVYGDVQQVYEVHPSGTGYRLTTRFAKFVNLPSLMELYRGFADVITMDDLKQQAKDAGGVFPVPKIKGGKPRNIVAERSEQQRRFFGVPEFGRDDKGGIAFKYPAELFVRKSDKDGKWYPWLKDGSKIGNEGFDTEAEAEAERATLIKLPVVGWNSGSILHQFENLKQLTKDTKGKINALSITNQARKAGLDYRLIDPAAADFAGSKINLAVKEAVRIYHAWAADKGAQLMFCDLSVPKTARAAAASKERNAYVRAPDGGLDQVKATVVTIEGVEASFLAVKRGGKGAEGGYVLYDGLTGAHTGIAEHQKKDAVDALKAKIERDGLGWLEDLQDRYGEITDADIADYKDASGKEEESGEEGDEGAISVAELMALAGGNTFSVYDDIKAKLIDAGIPASEIAFIHDFDTAAKKNDLFKKVRAGDIRILLGSTEKMGAGMNVQERLVALHHLDAPWRPSDLEQREGRIIRQGNKLYERDPDGFEVELMRYGTRQTYDTRMWQIIEHKAAGVEQLRKAGDDLLEIDDIGGEAANAADMKAAASGNPLILDEIKLRNEVRSLEAQQFAHIQAKANLQDKARWYRGAPDRAEKEIAEIQPMVDMADKIPADPFRYTTPDGKVLEDKKDVALPLTTAFADAAQSKLGETIDAGQYRGLLIRFRKSMSGITAYLGSGAKPLPAATYGMEDKFSPSGLFTRLDNALERLKATIAGVRSSAASAIDQVPKLEAEIAKPFAREDALKDTRDRHRAVVSKLQKSGGGIELSPEMRAELDAAIATRSGKKGAESRGKPKLGDTMPWREFGEYLAGIRASDAFGRVSAQEKRHWAAAGESWRLVAVDPKTLDEVNADVSVAAPIIVSHGDVLDGRNRRTEAAARGDTAIAAWVAASDAKVGAGNTAFKPVDTNSPEFKAWFGDSNVVDDDGNPLRVYHATDADIEKFDPKRIGSAHGAPSAFFGFTFTGDAGVAGSYGKSIMSAFLKMENPYLMTWDEFAPYEEEEVTGRKAVYLREKLKRMGFDGIRIEDADLWIAFYPTQIKSAISNTGSFSRTNPSILESRTPTNAAEPATESARIVQSITDKFKAQFKGTEALTIRVVRTAQDIPARFRPSPFAEGVFHDDAGLIYLVTMNLKHSNGQVNAGRVWQVLMHEAVGHFGLAQMMGSRFAGILKQVQQAAKAKGEVTADIYEPGHSDYATMEAVRLRYPEASDEEVAQEVLARMAETDPGRTLFGYVRAVVRQWLRDMARAAGFDLDVTTTELNDLVALASAYMRRGDNLGMESMPSGTVAASRSAVSPAPTFKAADTESPEFKRWFGDSKVVDADGKPLVVYHGTDQDFDAFSFKWFGRTDAGARGKGFYFSEDSDYASRVAESAAASGIGEANVIPVYLRAESPYEWDGEVNNKGMSAEGFAAWLESNGYDSVHNAKTGEWVVLSPTQIKSATSNTGAFSATNPSILESRRAPGSAKPKEPRTGMLDTILRKAGGELAAKITGPAYDKLTAFLGGKVPEGIKAGMVSDYGLDESYIDRRTGMQTEQQKAARQTKTFVEGMMGLDRAQSRVAYQWLNNRGAEADRLMAQLPPESQQVLKDIKAQIAKLTIEAVRLGQLDAETASRNFLAYLHRSYAKYDLNTDDKTWKAERAKAIKILGDQYKGRGLKMDVDPDRIHSAPGWWQDEMKGKRVKVLKNDAGRFAFVAEGTAIPPNYAGYKLEGVWEIRARKADNRITLWRDFTQDERTMMGELDEAKYAVARTLFMMTRDIEVGRFHEWVADEYAKLPEDADTEAVQMAEPSESMMRAFRTDEWVTVPTAKIPGTGVFKFGALAGMVVPGPVWNDIRQISAGNGGVLAETWKTILRGWKLSKTALTPTTHVNNIMGNFVMADMHDVGARDVIGAVRLMLAASNGDKDAQAMLDRFEDSGATQGMFTTHELKREVLEPLLKALREEVGMADDEGAILKASAILSLALHGQIGEAVAGAKAAVKQSAVGRGVGAAVTKAQDYYQAEDALFRFAAFLKGIEDGKTDRESGKAARKAFLDYHINAPWINAMRGTAMPFIAFAYRAIPMLIETAAKKPWKVAKYMLVAGGLNALAYAMLGADGDEDKERAYLPDEKAGRLWGIVPKLIRMPWNRESTLRDGRKTSDPVFLDVRRWIPVGDVVDYGQDKTALPLIPQPLMPGGPLIIAGEFLVNKSAFTGRGLTKETDTWVEKAAKVGGHFYKGFAPNVPIPYSGTWAGTKIDNAIKGKEDPLGRAYPVPEAIASGFGLKLERYPVDTLQRNAVLDMKGKLKELGDEQRQAARDYGRQGMTKVELDEKVTEIVGKKNAAVEEYKAKERRAMGR